MLRAFLTDPLKSSPRSQAVLETWLAREQASMTRTEIKTLIGALAGDGIALDACEEPGLPAIELLTRLGALQFARQNGGFTVHAIRADFALRPRRAVADRWKASKFTYLTFETGPPAIRNPLSDRYLIVRDPTALGVLATFADARPLEGEATGIADAMADAAMLLPCDRDGSSMDDREPARRMWELHDLILHSRSRLGRTDGAVGTTYRFRDAFPEPVAAHPATGPGGIDLPEPGPEAGDPPLFATGARRRSVRRFAETPPTLSQLGAFLHHALRARPRGDAIRRVYPNAGGLHEQSFYLAVDRSEALSRGLYRYDDRAHRLHLEAEPSPELDRLFEVAARAMAVEARPPALIVITSRFGQAGWKYSGLAYALQLKNAGVILEWLYLTATAVGLGGCALGPGDSDAFGSIAGLDYLREGSIGEFAFGVPASG